MKLECTEKMTYCQYWDRISEALRNHEFVNIGEVQLLPEEAKEIYEKGLFVVTQHSIEKMRVTPNGLYISDTVYRTRNNLTLQGRYFIKTKEEVMELTEGKAKV